MFVFKIHRCYQGILNNYLTKHAYTKLPQMAATKSYATNDQTNFE